MTEWRIQKRVEEQFNAFATGFHELIPPDLVNVFDERELELLIGGIADIDVEDWKKHTDYRGYTAEDEVIRYFWQVSIVQPRFFVHCIDNCASVSEAGTQSKSRVCYNSQQAPLGYLSTASKIYRVAMGLGGSPSKNQDLIRPCPNHIHGKDLSSKLFPSASTNANPIPASTVWIFQSTRHMKHFKRN